MRTEKLIAVCCSDLHLSLAAPACRADDDWLLTQANYLRQLRDIAGNLPVICAGDLFDRWNASPELIHFALEHLPDRMICVPGQHDLPNHSMGEKHRSGYGVLAKAGKIMDLTANHDGECRLGYLSLRGFGWDQCIGPPRSDTPGGYASIAVIHRYCWISEETRHPEASNDSKLSALKKTLRKYDIAIFGDNHKGWVRHRGGDLPDTEVMNCGTFMRRKSDEINYRPSVGVIMDDGTIERRFLDTSGDQFHDLPGSKKEQPLDMREFLETLEKLGEHGLDFREAVRRHLEENKDLDAPTKYLILLAIDR